MDINLLVRRLQHGDNYTAQNEAGDSYQVNRPPTQLSIKAAEVIIALDLQIQQANNTIANLQRQLTELAQQHELLQNTNAATEPPTSN